MPLVYNPEAITVEPWSEAMLRVRVPAAAVTGHDLAVLPLDDERLANLPVMVAPSLARPDESGHIWVRVINPAQKRVRISQLTPLARFIVDPKITDADLEFSVDEIIDKISIEPGCTKIHRDDIRRMLASRRRLFASKLGWAHGYQHDIDIDPKEIPPHLPARRLSPEEYTALKEAIDKQFKAGLLEFCTSPYNARPFQVPKADGGKRVVIDYRLINEQIIKSRGGSSYPLPNVESNLNSLAKAKWFTAIDLLSGFHQIELTDRAKLVTAFSTPWGQMCYSRLPMGLTSSPGAFMMVVDSALRGLPPGIAVAYVDDILIPTDGDWDDHMRDVGMVMDRLIEAGFTVNPKKVFMGMREVPYLGYIVGAYGTRPNPERTKAIFDLMFEAIRTDAGAAARFTGMISFYARFIKNIQITLAPFHALKGKGANATAILNSLQLRASFALLRHQLATVTALTRPDYSKDFHIHVDMASSVGIGAALMQLEDVNDAASLRPVAFWSHKFTDNERGWSVRDQECYGLVKALEEWRPYILGAHTKIMSDHKSLQWFMHTAHADGTRIQSWVARIQHFDVDIQYIPGKDHKVADFFSRDESRKATTSAVCTSLEHTRSALSHCFRLRGGSACDVNACLTPVNHSTSLAAHGYDRSRGVHPHGGEYEREAYQLLSVVARTTEAIGYDSACKECRWARSVTVHDICNASVCGWECMQTPFIHCHHCSTVGPLASHCRYCGFVLHLPASRWSLQRGCREALTNAASVISDVRRICLFVPIWHDGVLHALVCTYQGESFLPAVETRLKSSRRSHHLLLDNWLTDVFETESCACLRPLLRHAQYIGPVSSSRTHSSYLVTPPSTSLISLVCKAASDISAAVVPLHLGNMPAFSADADRAFCLRYIAHVARTLAVPYGVMEWKLYKLRGHSPVQPTASDSSVDDTARCKVATASAASTELAGASARYTYRQQARARDPAVASADGLPRIGDDSVREGSALFCDDIVSVVTAEQRLIADLGQSGDRTVALDLEGNLGGAHPHVALLQIKSAAHLFVIDTHVVRDALALRGDSLRSILLDDTVAKVVHSCYGDASALRI